MKFCTTDEALVQWLRLSSGIRGLGSNPPALFPLLKSHPPLLREKKKMKFYTTLPVYLDVWVMDGILF